jgi:gliding motility-associated-like protein
MILLKNIWTVIAFMTIQIGWSQTPFFCGSDQHEHLQLQNLEYRKQAEELEETYVKKIQSKTKGLRNQTITIPVVFHVIHNNGPENISDNQILKGLKHLNDAFANVNEYIDEKGVDTKIQFCLAQRDEDNSPFTGITRHQSTSTDMSTPGSLNAIRNIVKYDDAKYFNIYIVKNACIGGNCNIAGFGGYQTSFVQSDVLGTSTINDIVFVHEMGHALGLDHTFKGGCKNDNCLVDGDKVCDTPPDNRNFEHCITDLNSCATDMNDVSSNNPFRPISLGGLGDQSDDHTNFMDYNPYQCLKHFTQGQADRMLFFIQEKYSSLLTSRVCLPPCEDDVLALFSVPDSIAVGSTLTVTNQSVNGQNYIWSVDGLVVGTQFDLTYIFNQVGNVSVSLFANSGDTLCESDIISRKITVYCPVDACINYQVNADYLVFEDCSLGALVKDWIVINLSGDTIYSSILFKDSLLIDDLDFVRLCLKATGEHCDDTQCIYITLSTDGKEICGNDIDDDGDGLIDGFDPDCPCDNTAYQSQCKPTCELVPDSFPNIKIKMKWESENLTELSLDPSSFVIADVDSDDKPEILINYGMGGRNNSKNYCAVLNGYAGKILDTFRILPEYTFGELPFYPAIGKNTITNKVQTYINSLRTIVSVDKDGNEIFRTTYPLNYSSGVIGLSDFDSDGHPEVFAGSVVFNGQTGDVLYTGKNNQCGNNDCVQIISIAADVLGNDGKLELITGRYVHQIEINNTNDTIGNSANIIEAPLGIPDGKCAVADIDGDGLLEIIVLQSNYSFYGIRGSLSVWNPRTGTVLAQVPNPIIGDNIFDGGMPFVGDIDGDCIPEIGVVYNLLLRMYKYNPNTDALDVLYTINTSDKSGTTGVTMFDFNQDGKQELVYRDETYLRIIEGATGITIDSFQLFSKTWYEYPIVADVDSDGQAEIIISGSRINDNKEMRLYCFESASSPWAPSRSVWNQYAYNPTQVNEDLTIPRYQQNASAFFDTDSCAQFTCPQPYNNFMVQATYRTQEGCVVWPASDVSLNAWRYECNTDSLIFYLVVGNEGDKNITEDTMDLSIYAIIPDMTASPLDIRTIYLSRDADGMVSRSDTIRLAMVMPTIDIKSILFRINDAGLGGAYSALHGLSPTLECDYENNSAGFDIDISTRTLELGPNILKCRTEVITLDAGIGFVSYLWSDLSEDPIFSTSEPGIFSLTAMDQCGRSYQDSVTFTIDESLKPNLGPDILLCEGDTVSISVSNEFTWVQWYPEEMVSCDTCLSTLVTADTTFDLVLISNKSGCIDADTITIDIKELPRSEKQTSICAGTSIDFYGQEIDAAGKYEHRLGQCDSLIILDVTLLRRDSTILSQDICVGDSILVFDTWYDSSIETTLTGKNIYGCDSIVQVSLRVIDTLTSVQSLTFCEGDSIFVQDRWIDIAGTYDYAFTSTRGCDSIATYDLVEIPASRSVSTLSFCQGDSIYIQDGWITSAGKYDFAFTSTIGCDSIATYDVIEISTSRSISNFSFCQGDSIYVADQWYYDAGSYEAIRTNAMGCDSIINIEISTLSTSSDLRTLSICIGDSIQIHNTWQQQTGTYTETFTNSQGCDSTSVVTLSVAPFLLENDSLSICNGDSIIVNGQMVYTAGLYVDTIDVVGSCQKILTTQVTLMDRVEESMLLTLCPDSSATVGNLVIDESGTFTVDLTSQAGCDSTLTIVANKLFWPQPPIITINCQDEQYISTWTAQAPWNIEWSDGSTDTIFRQETGGTITMRSYIDGCEKVFEYELPQIPKLSDIPQLGDRLVKGSASLPLSVDLDETSWTIAWSPEGLFSCATCFDTEVNTDSDTTITVVMTHESGCSFEQQFRIIRDVSSEISVPNIFNPTSTGGNDLWTVTVPNGSLVAEISIYDRWGNQVFTSKNGNQITWDGNYQGKALSTGVYVYHVKVVDGDGKISMLYGDVTLVR